MKDFTITHIGDTALSLPMPFKFIPAKGKTFLFQGDDGTELGTKSEGIPITFENDFCICSYQTTQEFWERVVITVGHKTLKAFPSNFECKTRPIEKVMWEDIPIFNEALNQLFLGDNLTFENGTRQEGLFSIPSETQWEYAAEASQGMVFSGSQNLNDVAWYSVNSNSQTMPVGLKQPNRWGLYDMSGNVWEWCADTYTSIIAMIPKNGLPYQMKEGNKSLRGGSFLSSFEECNLRGRYFLGSNSQTNHIGFRLSFKQYPFNMESE